MTNKLRWKGRHIIPRKVDYGASIAIGRDAIAHDIGSIAIGYDAVSIGFSPPPADMVNIKIAKARDQEPQERFSAIIGELEGRPRIDFKGFKLTGGGLGTSMLPEDD